MKKEERKQEKEQKNKTAQIKSNEELVNDITEEKKKEVKKGFFSH